VRHRAFKEFESLTRWFRIEETIPRDKSSRRGIDVEEVLSPKRLWVQRYNRRALGTVSIIVGPQRVHTRNRRRSTNEHGDDLLKSLKQDACADCNSLCCDRTVKPLFTTFSDNLKLKPVGLCRVLWLGTYSSLGSFFSLQAQNSEAG
jgi:hypothetical protein